MLSPKDKEKLLEEMLNEMPDATVAHFIEEIKGIEQELSRIEEATKLLENGN